VEKPSKPSLPERLWSAIQGSVPWVLLFLVGLALQGIVATQDGLAKELKFVLNSLGGGAALLGSFGVGERLGREQSNEALRVKLATAFRRTARNYARMLVVKQDVGDVADEVVDAATAREMVPLHVVIHGLDIVTTRLDDEITTYDNALDEWSELVPAEVDKVREEPKAANE
jgi:hypothetical protein